MSRAALSLALLLACSAPLAAQGAGGGPLPPGCSRTKQERPAKRPRPAEARKDSIRHSIRTAIREDLRASARSAGVAEPRGVVIISTDRRRTEVEARRFRSNLPDSIAPAVAVRALPALRSWPDPGAAYLYFRLDTLPTPQDTTYECAPDIADRKAVSDQLTAFARQELAPGRPSSGSLTNHVRMLVTREGEVADVELARSSGSVRFDSYVLAIASGFRFRPGVSGGTPVDVLVTLPITAVLPGERPGQP
ncbi:MAG TPA: TonB family protein [Longimicrobiaceae bacterium]